MKNIKYSLFSVVIYLFCSKAYAIGFEATLPLGSPEAIDFHISMPGKKLGDVNDMFSNSDLSFTLFNDLATATAADGSTRQLDLTGGYIGNNTGFFDLGGTGNDGLINSIGVAFPNTPLLPGETIFVDFPTIPEEFEDELAQFFSFTFEELEPLVLSGFLNLDVIKGNGPNIVDGRKDDEPWKIFLENENVVIFAVPEPNTYLLFLVGLVGLIVQTKKGIK